jgi:hypothetical protein
MKHHGDISYGALEIFTALRDVAVDQTHIVSRNPAENARLPDETAHAPLAREQRFGEVTSDEPSRSRDQSDA